MDTKTVFNWENTNTVPRLTAMPKILGFLGYNPLPSGQALGEQLRLQRIAIGLTQKQLAQKLGMIRPRSLIGSRGGIAEARTVQIHRCLL